MKGVRLRPLAGVALLAGLWATSAQADDYLQLQLADGSVVRVLTGSDAELRRLRRKESPRRAEPGIAARHEKTDPTPTPSTRGRNAESYTPSAIASVRG